MGALLAPWGALQAFGVAAHRFQKQLGLLGAAEVGQSLAAEEALLRAVGPRTSDLRGG